MGLIIRLWRALLTLLGIIAILLGFSALTVLLLTVITMLNGRVSDYLYYELAKTILGHSLFIYLLFSAGVYLVNRGAVAHYTAENSETKKYLFYMPVPVQKVLNILLIFGVGFAVAMLAVSASLEYEYRRLAKESSASKKPYLQGQPALTFTFEVERTDSASITTGRFSSFITSYFMQHVNYDEYVNHSRKMYEDAQKGTTVTMVEIIGYADSTGDPDKNRKLSDHRTQTVRAMLIDAGIPEDMISIRAAGMRATGCERLSGDERDKCLSNDRRVDVYFNGVEE